MTDTAKREAARQFIQKWNGKGKEDEDDRSFWLDISQRILGISDATDRIEFQKKVIVDGHTKRIDGYIPETRIMIEQKSLGIALDKEANQSGGIMLTPYGQAKRYNDNLPVSEKARWIVTSNFAEIWIYDMDTREPEKNVIKIALVDLQDKYTLLDFLFKKEITQISEEKELSIKAGELVGDIHDRFLEQYNDPMAVSTQQSLNILCVRLVFCLYAEDAGLFGDKDAFKHYIEQYEPKDIRRALLDLFKVLNTPEAERGELYLDEELEKFPYCNGGLFESDNIEIPKITEEIKQTLINSTDFDWKRISPTIFGAVFESTLNPETRRSGGMHYTSIENIHKVIDPLFLDELREELTSIKQIAVIRTKESKLREFQDKLASLRFLDPASGSGNFLTETYMCIRRLENDILRELNQGQVVLGVANPIKVSINQFYGIEINDFAVEVAKAALWIAESQMMKETEDVVHMNLNFLPLKTNAHIVHENALKIDWNRVVPASELNYIMGNPPFVGASMKNDAQKEDVANIFVGNSKSGKLDYVSCWYKKATNMMSNYNIKAALVSTNSITQGEQAAILWDDLFTNGIHINFAHRTFIWDSEVTDKAHVHCVIIGFSKIDDGQCKKIYDGATVKEAQNINAYLLDAPDITVSSRKTALLDIPEICKGFQATDNGYLILNQEEKDEILSKDGESAKWIRSYSMGVEFINNIPRYCLWLKEITPSELRKHKEILNRVELCQKWRTEAKKTGDAFKLKDTPHLFRPCKQFKDTKYIAVPLVSSGNRRYVPMGYISNGMIPGNNLFCIFDTTLYHFGILTSNVHMSWIRTVGGRLKSDYRYSKDIVYNNFPWPNPTDEQKNKIEQTAQSILDARELYPDSSLADLYDPLTMPQELRKAHKDNDRAVMEAYGFDVKNTNESDCVAHLMKMYQELTAEKK